MVGRFHTSSRLVFTVFLFDLQVVWKLQGLKRGDGLEIGYRGRIENGKFKIAWETIAYNFPQKNTFNYWGWRCHTVCNFLDKEKYWEIMIMNSKPSCFWIFFAGICLQEMLQNLIFVVILKICLVFEWTWVWFSH